MRNPPDYSEGLIGLAAGFPTNDSTVITLTRFALAVKCRELAVIIFSDQALAVSWFPGWPFAGR